MTSKRYTHRVLRGFPINGNTYERGELVSSDDWTWQGKIYVEARGWVEPLEPKLVAHYAELVAQEERDAKNEVADAFVEKIAPTDAEIVAKVKAVRKTTPAKKATKPVAKKVANKPVKKTVKKSPQK